MSPQPPAVAPGHEFWRLMATNDFDAVGVVLAPDFVLEAPQSDFGLSDPTLERNKRNAMFARLVEPID